MRAAKIFFYLQFVLRAQGTRVKRAAWFYSADLLLQELGSSCILSQQESLSLSNLPVFQER